MGDPRMTAYIIQSTLTDPQNLWWIILLVVWELTLKGIALWKSARHSQRQWFVAILLINSLGILPLIYIQFFQKRKK